MQYKPIPCPRCGSLVVKKNGRTANQKQRYRCRDCLRQFLTDYTYQACRPEIRQLIVPLTLNGSGLRDITRVLKVSLNTVLKVLREAAAQVIAPPRPVRITHLELDELWSFVGNKQEPRWLWYAFDPARKQVVAWQSGRRNEATGRRLWQQLEDVEVLRYCTDEWEAYQKFVPPERHWIGKAHTQDIERQNLNIRTHLKRYQRKTICFSKSEVMHDAVTKLYLNYANRQHLF